jgi:hypothetical protein
VAALTGVDFRADDVDAADGKNKPKKRKACLCSATGCQTKKVKKRARFIRRNAPCAYKGACTSVNPCAAGQTTTTTTTTTVAPGPGPECTANADCPDRRACRSGVCSPCTHFSQCAGGEACLAGRCIGTVTCSGDADCDALSPLLDCEQAAGPNPLVCLLLGQCPPAAMGVACAGAGEFCVLGECVVTCSGADPCTGPGKQCINGLCIQVP